MKNFLESSKIMVVVAHPDDEILGLGGTMHNLIKDHAAEVHVVILGEGITSRSDKRDLDLWKKELELHKKNIHEAKDCIGYQSVSIYDLPDNRFDSVDLLDVIKIIESEKASFKPDTIFTHHSGDLNIDHQITSNAVVTACRPMEHEVVKRIVTFETPSGTEWQSTEFPVNFAPNLFVEINEDGLEAKIKAMESYELEKRPYPHPRSPEALKVMAQARGISVGKKLAEAFQIIRWIA